MKYLISFLLSGVALFAQVQANETAKEPTASAGTTAEPDRLMQAYMAQRAKRVALKKQAVAAAKLARSEGEKKRIFEKLEEDQASLREEEAKLAGMFYAADKSKRAQGR